MDDLAVWRILYKRGHLAARKLDYADGAICDRCGLTAETSADGRVVGELLTRDCGRPSGVSAT